MVQYGARAEKWLYYEEVRSTDEREVGYITVGPVGWDH